MRVARAVAGMMQKRHPQDVLPISGHPHDPENIEKELGSAQTRRPGQIGDGAGWLWF
jgi:hypothetical protein